jgi:hypothetical protein
VGKKKAAASPETESAPTRATFQAFERMTAMRSSLRFPENNPRNIDPHSFKKLKEYIKKNKLLGSLIVNRRTAETGHPPEQEGWLIIIGGNQRTKAMDSLSGFDPAAPTAEADYQVPIDVVSLAPGKEKEAIIALNNVSMMGSFDIDLLADLLTSPDVDPLAVGFDRIELSQLLDAGVFESVLGGTSSAQAQSESPVIDAIGEIAASSKQYQQQAAQAAAAPASSTLPPEDYNSVESIKGRREKFQNSQTVTEDTDENYLIVLAANDSREAARLLRRLNLPLDQTYFDLRAFLDRMEMGHLLDSSGDDPADSAGSAASAAFDESEIPAQTAEGY